MALYDDLVTAHVGREVILHEGTDEEIKFTIHGAAKDRMGALGGGETGGFLLLFAAEPIDNLDLHPLKAMKLLTKGKNDNFVLVDGVVDLEKVVKPEPVIQRETLAEKIGAAAAAAAAAAEGQKAVQSTTPKSKLAARIYADEVKKAGAGNPRKATIDRFIAELHMSKEGASTYYQSCKAGRYTP